MQYVHTFPTVERPWGVAQSLKRTAADHTTAEPSWGQGIMAMAAASGLSLLFPVAALVIGAPIALAVRGIVEVIEWLL